jgi:hypothetical protein
MLREIKFRWRMLLLRNRFTCIRYFYALEILRFLAKAFSIQMEALIAKNFQE